jgi:hypothetical protein
MNTGIRYLAFAAVLSITGCSTPNVNPPSPRANTGYVDFYTDSALELDWEVKQAEEPGGQLRTVFSDLKPVEGTILRLAATPGTHRFQVWFMDQVTEGPQAIEARIENGQITPVHVTLTAKGTTLVDIKEYRFGGSAKGYGRGTRFFSEQNQVFQIGLAAEPPRPYRPKEQMPYFSPAPK